jgi:inosine-uridine nucleoside N-ribohydrolase
MDMQLRTRLARPSGKIDVVMDTDAYNEIDDQFAIAYMLGAEEKLNVRAIYATPFFNSRSSGPEDGMIKSYEEIMKILDLAGNSELKKRVYRGSSRYLPDENTPVDSDVARDLISRAMVQDIEKPLYVVAIGAITNIASALLIEPEIRDRIVLVWLGGHAVHWTDTKEFNMCQDYAAARVVFGCGVPLVQLPCMGVVNVFRTTGPELERWLKGTNPLADYLVRNTTLEAESYAAGKAWSRVIWDVTAVGWLLDENETFMKDRFISSPIPQNDGHYSFDASRHDIKYVWHINRDALFTDLFARISNKR